MRREPPQGFAMGKQGEGGAGRSTCDCASPPSTQAASASPTTASATPTCPAKAGGETATGLHLTRLDAIRDLQGLVRAHLGLPVMRNNCAAEPCCHRRMARPRRGLHRQELSRVHIHSSDVRRPAAGCAPTLCFRALLPPARCERTGAVMSGVGVDGGSTRTRRFNARGERVMGQGVRACRRLWAPLLPNPRWEGREA